MDKTQIVAEVADLFSINGCKVDTSIIINHREIDVKATETQGLIRKIILIECADYQSTVSIAKVQEDIIKLRSAKEELKDNAIICHVSRLGYIHDALAYCAENGIETYTLEQLQNRIVNFDPYVDAVKKEHLRATILKEYQPNKMHYENNKAMFKSIEFLEKWLKSGQPWLTILGDYGVGKSWTLKRYLYYLIDLYETDKVNNPFPFFIPLQMFTKAFDFENLVNKTLSIYNVVGVSYHAIEYLMNKGRLIFLLDSFDEMAQNLSRNVIRENLREILSGVKSSCRAIMTSRPNYFERRSERLLVIEQEGSLKWHQLDEHEYKKQSQTTSFIRSQLNSSQFARICDLTLAQRKQLFLIVLQDNIAAYNKLSELLDRFHNIEGISQRAVIARLLTTVASTLTTNEEMKTIDGDLILPEQLKVLNESKIFQIVVYNLLYRDLGYGNLNTSERLLFLKTFAVYLQQPNQEFFAYPEEIYHLVTELFSDKIQRTDTPESELENMYRVCRRHSGLTTESQFKDTSGQLDDPVDAEDNESKVGFSHNSIREYLVSEAFIDYIKNNRYVTQLNSCRITDTIANFVYGASEYDKDIKERLGAAYKDETDNRMKEVIFKVIISFIKADKNNVNLLGSTPEFTGLDISLLNLSYLPLANSTFKDCISQDTDFYHADLKNCKFINTLIEEARFDDALLDCCDFTNAELQSIYVYDEFNTETSSILSGKEARQWLYSHGAIVSSSHELNPLLGRPWYIAAREVVKTIEKRPNGSHQDVSLAKGTNIEYRTFAKEFVKFLVKSKILLKVKKSDDGPGWILKLDKKYHQVVLNFNEGIIDKILEPYFKRYIDKEQNK